MYYLYKIGIEIYYLLIRISVPFYSSAAVWFRARKKQKKIGLKGFPENRPVIWFHASSLGEYEQALPLLIKWRAEKPGYYILLTFYSPSGYEHQKNTVSADKVLYLPRERRSEIREFLDVYNPQLAIFIKYDVWPVLLDELRQREIPAFLIAAVFRRSQMFFKWYGRWYLSVLKRFSWILVQDAGSLQLLKSRGLNHVKLFGDTRIDRVVELADQNQGVEGIADFKGDNILIVAGSSWPPEEEYLKSFLDRNKTDGLKIIIAPHNIGRDHINDILDQFGNSIITYSQLLDNPEHGNEKKVLLIDRIGILSKIYYHSQIAFVGGAFGAGLHNILEPAVYGVPVIFGPRYSKFVEAVELINSHAAFSVKSYGQFENKMLFLINNENALSNAGKGCRDYVNNRKGATGLIISHLLEKL